MMSLQRAGRKCCVPGCMDSGNVQLPLHGFPNPVKDRLRFNTWVTAIGGEIIGLDSDDIYKHCEVCHLHFEENYICRYNRLSNVALPTLNLPAQNNSVETEKPVQEPLEDTVKFPPFPDPSDADFDDDISEAERLHYKTKFKDINKVTTYRIHCTACDRHLGCSARNETRLRPHPMLRTLMCHICHTFYNSGEFEKGDDGSELYCRWCGQGGQVYCCSACPHVFCAKCVKRNFGMAMIKEIEDTDDWKCFKCNSKYLWDLRALCWAVLRYCDLKNRITYATQDPDLKEIYQKDSASDLTTCCKSRNRKKNEEKKTKPKEDSKITPNVVAKVPSTIQVKKFASINVDEAIIKIDKKPQKRPASPKSKPIILKNPMSMATKILTPVVMPPMAKRMRMSSPNIISPVRINNERKSATSYTRIRPQPPMQQIMFNGFNSNTQFNQMLVSDNINLSLESLTQGLDMATVAGMANNSQDNDVVCTPDFPLEPLCEVTEDTNDDDVQCIGPVIEPKGPQPPPPLPPLMPRSVNSLPSLASDNIIQMTENDVTVNSVTGGLKFRVDPQTLSSNKMYRLPDGRIFAINANPTMPGGYSATIVAVTDDAMAKMSPKGATYAAKLSSVGGNQLLTPPPLKEFRSQSNSRSKSKRSVLKTAKSTKRTETPTRDCDMNVPVEWFRYNVIDAVDTLEYSLSRMLKLKQEATTMYLRTRSVTEMRNLHRRLERLLSTSTCRFNEIRENINKELKQYLLKKLSNTASEDDDDVEILHDEHDDPIFIDENSVDSNVNENQEVDLTVMGSSDHNDSSEKSLEKNDSVQILEPLCDIRHQDSYHDDSSILPDKIQDGHSEKPNSSIQEESILPDTISNIEENDNNVNGKQNLKTNSQDSTTCEDGSNSEIKETNNATNDTVSKDIRTTENVSKESEMGLSDVNSEEGDCMSDKLETLKDGLNNHDKDNLKIDKIGGHYGAKKTDDSEMSEEMIENLLQDEPDDTIAKENLTAMDVSA